MTIFCGDKQNWIKIIFAVTFAFSFIFLISRIPITTQETDDIIYFDHYVTGEATGYNPNNPYDFFQTAKRVYKKSNEVVLKSEETFDSIYTRFIEIFEDRYTTRIDDEHGGEYIQAVQELALNNYSGDCDDYAMFFLIMAEKLNERARMVTGCHESGCHAWLQINRNNTWIDYDSVYYLYGENAVSQFILNFTIYYMENGEVSKKTKD